MLNCNHLGRTLISWLCGALNQPTNQKFINKAAGKKTRTCRIHSVFGCFVLFVRESAPVWNIQFCWNIQHFNSSFIGRAFAFSFDHFHVVITFKAIWVTKTKKKNNDVGWFVALHHMKYTMKTTVLHQIWKWME